MGLDDPFPDFAWSHSRYRTLQDCARRYYYSHYGSWQGWNEDAPREKRLAYRLNKLTALDLEVGSSIHQRAFELTEIARQGRTPPPAGTLKRRTREDLRPIFEAVEERFIQDPKANPMLRSAYYGDGPEEDVLDRVRDKIERCHPNLRELDLWQQIRDRDVRVLHAEDRESGYTGPNVKVDGVGAFAKPDLVLEEDDETWSVVDWKTGIPQEEDHRQLTIYGLALRQDSPPTPLRGRIVYLLDGSSRVETLTEDRINRAGKYIRDGIEEMRQYVADPDVNEPMPKDSFPLAENRWECRRCNFFELCEEELRETGPLPWE